MDDAPETCPACGSALPKDAVRCPACGRVFGDDNRCPSCWAHAGVFPALGGSYVCAACNAPREVKPGTTILAGPTALPRLSLAPLGPAARRAGTSLPPVRAVAARGKSGALRFFGVGAIGVGIFAATVLAVFIPGLAGIAAAAAMGGLWTGLGVLGLRAASRASSDADKHESTAQELSILELAEKSDGDLTATEVARGLGVGMREADDALSRMADGSHVSVEVDPEGIVHYVFREMRAAGPAGPRVRVDASVAPREVVDEVVEAERRQRDDRERGA